tara:strand:+ start:1550 stop:1717 length:168 start_codon:yes stop_codon:yes gene_type:complete
MSELRQKLVSHYLSHNDLKFSQETIDKWVIEYNVSEKDIRKLIITLKRELGRFII